jgi:hypothetical protein
MKTIEMSFLDASIKLVTYSYDKAKSPGKGSYPYQLGSLDYNKETGNYLRSADIRSSTKDFSKEFDSFKNEISKIGGEFEIKEIFRVKCISSSSMLHWEIPAYLRTLFNSAIKTYSTSFFMYLRQHVQEEITLMTDADFHSREHLFPLFNKDVQGKNFEAYYDKESPFYKAYFDYVSCIYALLFCGEDEFIEYHHHLLTHPIHGYYL